MSKNPFQKIFNREARIGAATDALISQANASIGTDGADHAGHIEQHVNAHVAREFVRRTFDEKDAALHNAMASVNGKIARDLQAAVALTPEEASRELPPAPPREGMSREFSPA